MLMKMAFVFLWNPWFASPTYFRKIFILYFIEVSDLTMFLYYQTSFLIKWVAFSILETFYFNLKKAGKHEIEQTVQNGHLCYSDVHVHAAFPFKCDEHFFGTISTKSLKILYPELRCSFLESCTNFL